MNHGYRVITFAIALSAIGCGSSASSDLSPAELGEVLKIRAWRIPQPAEGSEWSLEVVTEQPAMSGAILERGTALVTLRPTSEDEYEFVLKQRGAQGSGEMALCREPESTSPICDSYSIEFEQRPRCLDSCSRAVLAHLSSSLAPQGQRWLILVAEPRLIIQPDNTTTVTPVP
jgi:hypothetical protein